MTKDPYLDQIPGYVAAVFHQAQLPPVNYRKNCVNLHKIQDRAKDITLSAGRGRIKVIGEAAFQNAFLTCLYRVLPTRKGDLCGDHVARFIGAYMKFANERAHEEHVAGIDAGDISPDEDEDTWGTRFTAKVVKAIVQGFGAKDKAVRFRCIQIFESIIPFLGPIDEDLYFELRRGLLDRTKDKETIVRSNAAKCLAVLCPHETPEDAREGEATVQETLLEMLSTDSSPEVRKLIVVHIALNDATIPHIVKRTRDTDASVRKLVYKEVLKKGIYNPNEDEGTRRGLCHPARLSLEDLETIIKNGLRDRDLSVRGAAASLIDEWVKAFESECVKPEPDMEERLEAGVISLLELFNVVKRAPEDLVVVEDLLRSIFTSRKELFDHIEFQDDYWRELGPENAILPRVFIQHCRSDTGKHNKDRLANILENNLPVVSVIAKCVESLYDGLLKAYEKEAVGDFSGRSAKREFILREMLVFAPLLDSSDQFGWQQMDPLIKRLLEEDQLPLALVPPCLDILRKLAPNEYEFVKTVVEIVKGIHEGIGDEAYFDAKLRQSLPEEEQAQYDELDFRQLNIYIQMLKRTHSTGKHQHIEHVFDDVVVPNLKREDNHRILEAAMTCLGLCALVRKNVVPRVLLECLKQICRPPEGTTVEITILLFQTVFDLLLNYGNGIYALAPNEPEFENLTREKVHEVLLDQLGELGNLEVLAVVCEGLAKMILSGDLTDPVAIINLLQRWTDPAIQECQPIMQCLSYFFQRYSHSSAKNQQTMQKIFMDVFKCVAKDRQKLGEDEEMISSAKLCEFFEHWTHPLVLEDVLKSKLETAEYFVHLDMATEILKELFERTYKFQKEDKKALFQLLPKLYMPEPDDHTDGLKVVPIKLLIENLRKYKSPDGPSNTALTKFENTLKKQYEAQLEGFSDEEYRKHEGYIELYAFLDDLIPLDDDEEGDSKTGIVPPEEARMRGQKRRSRSARSAGTTDMDEVESPGPPESSSRARKRPRLSAGTTDDDGERSMHSYTKEEDVEMGVPPQRPRPRLVARPRPSSGPPDPSEVIYISSDSDEEGPSAPTASSRPQPRPQPKPRPKPVARYRRSSPPTVKQEEEDQLEEEEREEDIDRDISELLSSQRISSPSSSVPSRNVSHVTVGHDSLFSSDDEEEEDEVSGLLAD
ncbi:hypothetical protein H1R20_g3171, partial [Candolleomyces eurysporus]